MLRTLSWTPAIFLKPKPPNKETEPCRQPLPIATILSFCLT